MSGLGGEGGRGVSSPAEGKLTSSSLMDLRVAKRKLCNKTVAKGKICNKTVAKGKVCNKTAKKVDYPCEKGPGRDGILFFRVCL